MTMHYTPASFAQKVARIYPNVTPYRYAYRGKLHGQERITDVDVWFLLFEEGEGYTFKNLRFRHLSAQKTPRQWGLWVRDKCVSKINDWWLPSHNSHFERNRVLIKILLFTKHAHGHSRF